MGAIASQFETHPRHGARGLALLAQGATASAAIKELLDNDGAFDDQGLLNPGKVFPTPRLCGEVPGPYRQHPAEAAGVAERF